MLGDYTILTIWRRKRTRRGEQGGRNEFLHLQKWIVENQKKKINKQKDTTNINGKFRVLLIYPLGFLFIPLCRDFDAQNRQ